MPELHNAACTTEAECTPSSGSFTTSRGQDNLATSLSLEVPIHPFIKACPTLLGLPGEVRNILYMWCTLSEASKIRTIRYNCRPLRRSRRYGNSNFHDSFWSFTQTSRQIRGELLSWLLKDRRVRTPLATISKYLDVFHPLDPTTGARAGWIEVIAPKACKVPLPLRGVEVYDLLRHSHTDEGFHLHFAAQYPHANPERRDEIDLLYQLSHKAKFNEHVFKSTGINSIKLLPFIETPLDHHLEIPRFRARPSLKHAAMVKLDTVSTYTADGLLRTTVQQRWHVLFWLIFEVHLAHNVDLHIQARLSGYEAMWEVLGLTFLAGKWERYDDARGVIGRKYLVRGWVQILPNRPGIHHVVEMQLPQQP